MSKKTFTPNTKCLTNRRNTSQSELPTTNISQFARRSLIPQLKPRKKTSSLASIDSSTISSVINDYMLPLIEGKKTHKGKSVSMVAELKKIAELHSKRQTLVDSLKECKQKLVEAEQLKLTTTSELRKISEDYDKSKGIMVRLNQSYDCLLYTSPSPRDS